MTSRPTAPCRSRRTAATYLTNTGASKEPSGDRPVLDRLDVTTGKTEKLWRPRRRTTRSSSV
jgi:hypothetical protein